VTSARVAWPRAAILFGLGYFLIDPTWPMAIVLFPVFRRYPRFSSRSWRQLRFQK